MTAINFTVAPTMMAPTAAIIRIESKLLTDSSKCEANIHIGTFFDGTSNNRDADRPKLKHTNVVRLFDAYLEKPKQGYFRCYIPGVGTAFPEIRELGESIVGSSFGNGCEQRVLFALLFVFNAIHKSAFDGAGFLNEQQIAALCCNKLVASSADDPDSVVLGRLGLYSGLMMPTLGGDGMRAKILKTFSKRLQAALSKGRPVIKECFLDVFGFSRGAAEARVFCNWLDELLIDGKLAGVMVHLRFVGLMDTVASAGFVSSVGAAITGGDGGHSGWAEARHLRIPSSVRNCVHFIAAHELRKNFPIDTVTVNAKLPAHCQEFIYPGAHSDVGGGYAPGDLGIAFDSNLHLADAQKLAQVPLNQLLECAIAAGAPLDKERAKDKLRQYNPFALAPAVQKAYDDFVTCSTLKARPIREWLQPYLNWRWQVSKAYTSLKHVSEASSEDRALLIEYNARLLADAAFLDHTEKPNILFSFLPLARLARTVLVDTARANCFGEEARTVLANAKAAAATDRRLHVLFDFYVHDSLAGFNHNNLELSGYWRYRRGFLGDEKRLMVENQGASDADRALA